TAVSYGYDYQNLRTRADRGTDAKTFIWGGDTLLEEQGGPASSVLEPRLYQRAGGLVAGVGPERLFHDAAGSAVGRFRGAGFTQTSRFDAFGAYLNGAPSASNTTPGYAGQQSDPDLGLSYAQQRWYAPEL